MNRARWILIVLSLAIGAAGVFALSRPAFVSEDGRGREQDEKTRLVKRRNEVCLKRIQELERVYREEILPSRKGLTQNRQQLEELFEPFYPELDAMASIRDLGRWPPALDNEGGPAWEHYQEGLLKAFQDPRIWRSQTGLAPKDEGGEAFLKPRSKNRNGDVQ